MKPEKRFAVRNKKFTRKESKDVTLIKVMFRKDGRKETIKFTMMVPTTLSGGLACPGNIRFSFKFVFR